MRKKKVEVKPLPATVSDLEAFQQQYGLAWKQMLETPVFRAGMQLLALRKLDQITSLTNDDIEKYSKSILAEFKGQLKHENEMFNLHNAKEFTFPVEEEMVYVSPEEVEEHQQIRNKYIEQQKRDHYGSG